MAKENGVCLTFAEQEALGEPSVLLAFFEYERFVREHLPNVGDETDVASEELGRARKKLIAFCLMALRLHDTHKPVVAWMTEGRLPNKHKAKTHLTNNPRIAEYWRNSGMFVWPLVRLDPPAPSSPSVERHLCDCARCLELRGPAPHPVPPHTPGWNPVDACATPSGEGTKNA